MSAVEVPEIDVAERVRSRLRELPPLRYGSLTLPSRYLLSPLAGFTNLPFRRLIRELGGLGLGITDLVNARGLMEKSEKTLRLVETHPIDRPWAVQIFGSDIPHMTAAAKWLVAERDCQAIDINMGCPVHKVTRTGAGASLMCSETATLQLVEAVVQSVPVPVTVKMRLGWDSQNHTAPHFAREFEKLGVAAVMIHGRTRAQGFSGTVDREGIRRVVEAVEKIPVIANGDIRTLADAMTMFDATGCQGISIGRGALANPWIFSQLVAWEQTGSATRIGTFAERMGLLRRQFAYLQELVGEEKAVSAFRKMAHWYALAMHIKPALRHSLQTAKTVAEFEAALHRIEEEGPIAAHSHDGVLRDLHIPVPAGPNERW